MGETPHTSQVPPEGYISPGDMLKDNRETFFSLFKVPKHLNQIGAPMLENFMQILTIKIEDTNRSRALMEEFIILESNKVICRSLQ